MLAFRQRPKRIVVRGRLDVMLSTIAKRLRGIAPTLLVLCTWAWPDASVPSTDVLVWERAVQDSAAFRDTAPVVTARRARIEAGVDRARLARPSADTPIGDDAVVGDVEPSPIVDTGDQGDGFASMEPLAGAGVSLQSRVVRGGSPASLRSHSLSSASPRAPPSSLRLA